MTAAPDHNSGTQNLSTNTSKALPSIELFIVINATIFSILIAPIAVTFDPRSKGFKSYTIPRAGMSSCQP